MLYYDEVIKCLAERPRRHPPDGVDNLEGWSASSDRGIKKLPSPGNGLEEYFRDNSFLYYKDSEN